MNLFDAMPDALSGRYRSGMIGTNQGGGDLATQRDPGEARASDAWTLARRLALAWLGIIALWALLLAAAQADERLGAAALEWSRTPLLLIAVPLAWLAGSRLPERRARLAWFLIGLGYLSVAFGDTLDGWRVWRGLPSLALTDAFWLGYFPFVLAGVLCLPRVFRGALDRARFALDAGIVTTCGALLIWLAVLRPLLQAGTPAPVSTWIALAYPVGDLVSALAVALVLTRTESPQARRAHQLLALSFVASLAGDLNWAATYATGASSSKFLSQMLWSAWAAAFLAAAFALLAGRRLARAPSDHPVGEAAFGALPYLALGAGYGLCAWLAFRGDGQALRISVIGAAVLTALVVARMLVTQLEHDRLLTRTLERRGERRLAALVEYSQDAILVVDARLAIQYASPAAARLLGAKTLGAEATLDHYLHAEDAPALRQYAQACARGDCRHTRLTLRVGAGYGWRTAEAEVGNLLANPDIGGIVLNLRDVTERQALEDQLRFQALHDPLTGLPNRELFVDRFERALNRARQGQERVAVARIDLDRFQRLNDRIGRRATDQALIATAARMEGALGGADSLARFGADEFVALFEAVGDERDILMRTERLRAAVSEPFEFSGHRLVLSASIGTAEAGPGDEAEALLRGADLAQQQARAAGGDQIQRYDRSRHRESLAYLDLESELPALIERGAFAVQFQPVLELGGRTLVGLNARLGWLHPEQAPASMAAVVAAAAEAGRIAALGAVLRAGLAHDLRALVRYQPDAARLVLTLRLHAHELRDPELGRQLAAMMRAADLEPERLLVRVGAADFPRLPGVAEQAFAPLAEAGLKLALADVGAPGSGLDLITSPGISALFLARSLIARLDPGARDEALVRAALAGARALGLEVIAPGVARPELIDHLGELGVQRAYGDAVAPTLSFERLLPWLGARLAS